MGGGGPKATRPMRKKSRNPDCACFGPSGVVFFGLPFGLVFTATGALCAYGAIAIFLSEVVDRYFDFGFWFGLLGITAIGLGHATGGLGILYVILLRQEWLTIDRKQGVARKQTGVLCFRRFATATLAEFTEISIFPIPITWFARDRFEIALTGPNERRFPLGEVTLSYDLAREFGEEVATFLGLPLL